MSPLSGLKKNDLSLGSSIVLPRANMIGGSPASCAAYDSLLSKASNNNMHRPQAAEAAVLYHGYVIRMSETQRVRLVPKVSWVWICMCR